MHKVTCACDDEVATHVGSRLLRVVLAVLGVLVLSALAVAFVR